MASTSESAKVDGSDMPLYLSVPASGGPVPGLVVVHGQSGLENFIQDTTHMLALQGYAAVAPDLYHRDGPDCKDDGPTRRARLQDVTVIKDVNATVDFLIGHRSVDAQRLGIIGFCMGGRVSYLMAAANPHLKAAVAYYGGNIMVPWGEGPAPFERTAEMHCPLLGLFGAEDANPSPADMRQLDAELTRLGKLHEFHSYPGAGHAFMNRRGERYRADADSDSWPKTLAFFAKHLTKVAAAAR